MKNAWHSNCRPQGFRTPLAFRVWIPQESRWGRRKYGQTEEVATSSRLSSVHSSAGIRYGSRRGSAVSRHSAFGTRPCRLRSFLAYRSLSGPGVTVNCAHVQMLILTNDLHSHLTPLPLDLQYGWQPPYNVTRQIIHVAQKGVYRPSLVHL